MSRIPKWGANNIELVRALCLLVIAFAGVGLLLLAVPSMCSWAEPGTAPKVSVQIPAQADGVALASDAKAGNVERELVAEEADHACSLRVTVVDRQSRAAVLGIEVSLEKVESAERVRKYTAVTGKGSTSAVFVGLPKARWCVRCPLAQTVTSVETKLPIEELVIEVESCKVMIRVVDAELNAIPQAVVYWRSGMHLNVDLSTGTVSNGFGELAIVVAPGEGTVCAVAPGYKMSPLIVVALGKEEEVVIRCERGGAEVDVQIVGLKVHPEGEVWLSHEDSMVFGGGGGAQGGRGCLAVLQLRGVVGPSGLLHVNGLRQGRWRIGAKVGRYEGVSRAEVGQETRFLKVAVALGSVGAIHGWLLRKEDECRVDGSVTLRGQGMAEARHVQASAASGYQFEDVPPGDYWLSAHVLNYGVQVQFVRICEGLATILDLVVPRGDDLRVRVESYGSPVVGAGIRADTVGDRERVVRLGFRVDTAQNGEAVLLGLPVGEPIMLAVSASGYRPTSKFVAADRIGGVVVNLQKVPDCKMLGLVQVDGGQSPVGTEVWVRDGLGGPDHSRLVKSENGGFEVDGLPRGVCEVWATRAGFGRSTLKTIDVDGVVNVGVIEMVAPGVLSVVAVLPSGKALEHGWLTLADEVGYSLGRIEIKAGKAVSGPMTPGRYWVGVKGKVCGSSCMPVEISRGQRTELRVTVEDGREIDMAWGRAVVESGERLCVLEMRAEASGDQVLVRNLGGWQGRCKLQLRHGRYEACIRDGQGRILFRRTIDTDRDALVTFE